MNASPLNSETPTFRRRGRPRTSLKQETVVRWAAQDRNRLWYLKNQPEHQDLTWDEFQKVCYHCVWLLIIESGDCLRVVVMQQLDFFPGRTSLALSMAYGVQRLKKRIMRGGSIDINLLKRAAVGSSDEPESKRTKLEGDSKDDNYEESSSEEDSSDSEYEKAVSTKVGARENSTIAPADGRPEPTTGSSDQAHTRGSESALQSQTQKPQTQPNATPSAHATSHVPPSPTTAPNNAAQTRDTSTSSPRTSAVPPAPARQSSSASSQHRTTAAMATEQPSALSTTGLSEQCIAPAVESLIQSAHVLAQHLVIELQAQYAEKTTLLERRLDSFVQERAQMQHQLACLQGTTIELHGEVKNLHEQVRTIGTADQEKERGAERSSKQLLARLEETEKGLENTKLSTNKRSMEVQELKAQIDQVQKQLEEYDGMKSLSMFDIMKQMMVLNKKSTESGAA
ncbi:hypothetical protein BDV12DRAFT_204168 [Aspergillus spectabilis]